MKECVSCAAAIPKGEGVAINDTPDYLCDECFDDGNFPQRFDRLNHDAELDDVTDRVENFL